MALRNLIIVITLSFSVSLAYPHCPEDMPPSPGDTTSTVASPIINDTAHVRSSATIPGGGLSLLEPAASSTLPDGIPQPPKKFWIFNRKMLALGGTLAFSVPIVALEYQWWWRSDYKSQKHKFRYDDDGWFKNYSLGVDKCGHFFTSYLYFHTFYDLMKWADYSESTSLWTALAVPAAHAISVELCDGFSRYAFSGADLGMNFLGMGYAYAQIKVPYLRNFNIKWSYYLSSPSALVGDDRGFAADYTGHTYWMSVNMKNVLPEGISQFWPKYLNVAVGYGASNVSFGEDQSKAKHKFAFALDYNLGALPIVDDTWTMLVHLADKIHYPAPGIKTYTGSRTYAKPFLLY